jgi:hypothetical protein
MALVTAPQPTIPNFEYEHHTITVDNIDHSSKTDFIAHLPTPLENIVQVQLIAASITGSGGNAQLCLHINIEELKSYFSQRTKMDLESPNDNHLNGLFGSIMFQQVLRTTGQTGKAIYFRNDYPIIQQYINPIRKLDRLTFNIDKQNGDAADMSDAVFVFIFTCKKKNLPY